MLTRWLSLIILTPFLGLGQSGNISFRNININEGLSQSSVVDIELDQAGFIWFATQDGLNKFDGKRFEIFRKNFDDVTTLAGSKLGKLVFRYPNEMWMISSGGRLERMNLYTRQMQVVNKIGSDSTPLPPVSSLLFDKLDNAFIGTEEYGLYILDKKDKVRRITVSSHSQLPSNNIELIVQVGVQSYWICTDKGIAELTLSDSIQFRRLNSFNSIAASAIVEDQQGNKWIGTYGSGLRLVRKGDSTQSLFTGYENNLPSTLVIEALLIDKEGTIWVGTYGDGLYVINQVEKTVRHFLANKRNPNSLAYNDVLSLREDPMGGIWIGTDGGGVSLYNKRLNYFRQITRNVVPDPVSVEQVRSIATDQEGGIWIGTSNSGLAYANLKKSKYVSFNFKPYTTAISNYQRIVSLFADSQGDLWIGSQGNGLVLMDRTSGRIRNIYHPDAKVASSIPDHTIWCILPEDEKSIWVGMRNAGICLVDKKSGVVKSYNVLEHPNSEPADNNVRAITRVNDSVLCLGFEKGEILFFNTKTARTWSPSTSLDVLRSSGTVLKCLYYKDSLLWVGTLGKGIFCLNMRTDQLVHIDERRGLPNNTVYSILPDKQGALWMSTNNGLCRFVPPVNLQKTTMANFLQFNVEDGLQSNEFNTGAYHQSANGLMYFGGINGLNYFDPSAFEPNDIPARVLITQATVNNNVYNDDTSISYKHTLELSFDLNSLSFDFAALDFVTPNSYNYYYQLQGYDDSWIESGKRSYAAYTNLPPGSYLFKVRASKGLAEDNNPVTMLHIVIQPPFWRTWWFIAVCVLAVAALLYALYRYRIRQILHLQNIRNRIATDLHDDIGSALTNISLLSELTKKNGVKHDNSLFLDRISEEVNSSSQALDDIVWSINSNNDSLDQTVARMRRYAAEIFEAANISYSLNFDDHFAERKLNMEQRRDCFLIFKEAINNIYKHAQAKNVFISIWIERNHLFMTIEDDGLGFDVNHSTHRNGIKNIRHRTHKWKGLVTLESKPGRGTKISVEFTNLA